MTTHDERAEAQKLAAQVHEATYDAGILAMVVADKLADGDVSGAMAALPPYKAAAGKAEQIGEQLAKAAGYS